VEKARNPVLEDLEGARQRGALILAEMWATHERDAYHVTAPPETAVGLSRDAELARRRRNWPSQVDYINAHGTSTEVGDRARRWPSSAPLANTPTSWR